MKNKKIRNKKKLIPILALFILVGVTIAYFQTSNSFENIFNTTKYGAKIEEVFESPDNWAPGDETPKTITAKNTGNVCENVRVSYTEEWTSENDDTLPLEFETGKRAAILNLDNTSDWVLSNGYYYYQRDLLANETTTSFLRSVTFNPEYTPQLSCTTVGNTQECKSSGDSYAGAEYKLTITVETIQCDVAEDEWGYTKPEPVVGDNYLYAIHDRIDAGASVSLLGTTYESPALAATNFGVDIFLRHGFEDSSITSSSVTYVDGGNTYYLQGGGATYNYNTGTYNTDSSYYEDNVDTVVSIFGSANCSEESMSEAGGNYTYTSCALGDLYSDVTPKGYVVIGNDTWYCQVDDDGSSECDDA